MKNWRELGEVPDSDDDESLDNLDSQEAPLQETLEHPIVDKDAAIASKSPHEPKKTDIWDIPSSPLDSPDSPALSRTRLAPGQNKPILQSPSLPQIVYRESFLPANETDDVQTAAHLEDHPSSSDLSSLEDEIATGYIRLTPPRPRSSPSCPVPKSPNPSDTLEVLINGQVQAHDYETLAIEEGEELSRQAAVRLERSLRPRKPIQQHPYLLENAQYTNFMKSRGFKPVRVIVPSPPPGRRADEEDSQEQEFQTEESQDTSHGRLIPGTEESQPILFDDETGDQDPLALSPSPPKTSPGDPHLRASSQPSNGDHTDATSLSGDEEFPSIDRLLPESVKRRARNLKRRPSQLLSAKLKRQKAIPDSSKGGSPHRGLILPANIWDLSSSPRRSEQQHEPSQDLGNTPRSPIRYRTRPHQPPSRRPAPSRQVSHVENADFTILEEDDQPDNLGESDSGSATDSSGSGSDVIRQNTRRIRGVLPASWLRLDHRKDGPSAARSARHSPDPTLLKTPRRGVALPKRVTSTSSNANPFFFSESDESDGGSTLAPNRRVDVMQTTPDVVILDQDDGGDIEEEDHIDLMLPGRKRAASSNLMRGTKKRRRTKSLFGNTTSGQPTRQPKIIQVLSRSKSTSSSKPSKPGAAKILPKKGTTTSIKRASRTRAAIPPLLSILDVMEPAAPKFIRIAARTARRKTNLGKSSPSKKMISLATRRDNIDALSTLQAWKSGRTRPRLTGPTKAPQKEGPRRALQQIHPNVKPPVSRPQPGNAPSRTQKAAVQGNLDGFMAATDPPQPQVSPATTTMKLYKRKLVHKRGSGSRPAQLETNEDDSRAKRLSSKKRSLDALYRKSQNALDTSSNHPSDQSINAFEILQGHRHQKEDVEGVTKTGPSVIDKPPKNNAKSRFRKGHVPRSIDPAAPQYTRANDPLPAVITVIDEVGSNESNESNESHERLKGLGPYGTQYTQHFEVFPFEQGTYFHERTVIGSGYVRKAVEPDLSARMRLPRPAVSFVLDGQTLRWGSWDDKTSSEFGILFDWIAEQLYSGKDTNEEFPSQRTIEAASVVLDYVLDSLCVQNDDEEKAFILRCLEVFSNFLGRFESLDWLKVTKQIKTTLLEVVSRFLVALLPILSLSQTPGDGPTQSFKVEALLKRLASLAIKVLLGLGLEELQTLYGDLQRLSIREQGIRPRQVLANSWVVIMRVLESACIPRTSFWDLTHAAVLGSGVASGSDAQVFERHWQDMFTLLPLCEIDNNGILIPGLRNTAPMEGWTLPQQLMKRVFQLYKSNTRQSPSFNEYCRALVARCYFLVQLWGWRRCTGIIGTIFDFFGSQNLAHLRNEEVYRSPRFLEELNRNSSLSIEPDDRCFHIFIKLLALAIQRLKQLGCQNDVRNLMARTLPNHNRQYLREDTIHQHDLAALRNHHDLLCALFWAAPPGLRPAVHLVEKLVTPASAHKEACLINIKAWNQLARFVVSSGEGAGTFKAFGAWRNNIFNQVLDQYLSTASDIEQQFRALSEQMRGISTGMRDAMIAKNKATAIEILYFSVQASLDVLQHATSLESTVYALNTTQLQKIFTSLDYRSPGFDWSILRVALDTLELYLNRLDEASEEHYSSESACNIDSNQVQDAVLLLEDQLAKDFFWMARTTLGLPVKKSAAKQTVQALCAEKTVTLGSRIAARFTKEKMTQLSPYFGPGKYGLFSDSPKDLKSPDRKYFPLFIAILVKNHMFDFKDIESSLLGLWIISIIAPFRFLGYETYLAEVLQRHNLPFLERATVLVGVGSDYNSNHDFFACAIHYMRKSLREAGSTQSRQFREEFSKVLQLAMHKMKEDLALVRLDAAEHAAYMGFVRRVISLIKSHGVGICVVDPFFTQPSQDYSPPIQDPRMHTAGIIAYGVRLAEKEVTAVPQLFHYLYNNFKIALGNGKLEQERRILETAMENGHIMSFMLQFILPAIIQASTQVDEAWVLLETYVAALARLLTRSCVPRELTSQDLEYAVTGVLASVLSWFAGLRDRSGYGALSAQQLHVVNLLVTIANALQPSLMTWLDSKPDVEDDVITRDGLEGTIDELTSVIEEAHSHVGEVLFGDEQEVLPRHNGLGGVSSSLEASIRAGGLLSGLPPPSAAVASSYGTMGGSGKNPRVHEFVKHIVIDVGKNWTVANGVVMLKMGGASGGRFTATQQQPGGVGGSQVGSGFTLGSVQELTQALYGRLGDWGLRGSNRGYGGKRYQVDGSFIF
ncbi:Mus7/MMS22 family-domain-containing protein [Apodospora peruviana]|uniref:Mus7/MMS22 family-domain-containing protein n=1 Tax=Apodospora peruviana TaxID=516989 RepID=A0AAE0M1C3_9PEZI|nr:Mus7/MMS22 family-domain-containing protein [Apodospora peruviana]